MSWRFDSTAGAHVWDTQPLSDEEILGRNEELYWLKRQERSRWKIVNGRIAESGDPTMMPRGNYTAPPAYANQSATAVAVVAANALLWSPTSYTPMPAASVQAPTAFRLYAAGIVTTSTTSLTTTLNPSIGTTAQTGGSTPGLGASTALSLPAATAITAAYWWLEYTVVIRQAGEAGTAVGVGNIVWTTTAGPAATTGQALLGGGNTVATAINWVTTAQGLSIAAIASAPTVTITPNIITFISQD